MEDTMELLNIEFSVWLASKTRWVHPANSIQMSDCCLEIGITTIVFFIVLFFVHQRTVDALGRPIRWVRRVFGQKRA